MSKLETLEAEIKDLEKSLEAAVKGKKWSEAASLDAKIDEKKKELETLKATTWYNANKPALTKFHKDFEGIKSQEDLFTLILSFAKDFGIVLPNEKKVSIDIPLDAPLSEDEKNLPNINIVIGDTRYIAKRKKKDWSFTVSPAQAGKPPKRKFSTIEKANEVFGISA